MWLYRDVIREWENESEELRIRTILDAISYHELMISRLERMLNKEAKKKGRPKARNKKRGE